MSTMNRLNMNFHYNKYDIVIQDSFSIISHEIRSVWSGKKIIIITDNIVEKLYLKPLVDELLKICTVIHSYTLPNGEDSKCLDMLNQIYNFMLSKSIERSDLVIALGGGMIGDITGYAAATYLRGIALIQIPTTLLAQIDSSVGGKVAVNYQGYKNMIGAFYQPLLVYINTSVLETLPVREYKCGLAEAMVHALIADSSLLEHILENADSTDNFSKYELKEFIYRNCKIKADIVLQDEKDNGIRKILNFGHTIGHAMEGLYGYKYKHGECVSVGIVAAFKLSVYFQLIEAEKLIYIKAILNNLGLPVSISEIDWKSIVKRIKFDKKSIAEKIEFILPVEIGKVIIHEVDLNDSFAEILADEIID